jgi:hypothetical protein
VTSLALVPAMLLISIVLSLGRLHWWTDAPCVLRQWLVLRQQRRTGTSAGAGKR